MRQTTMIFLDPDDEIRCYEDTPDSRLVLEIGGNRGVPARIFATPAKLQELRGVIDLWLYEHAAIDGSADRADIVPLPAEAVVDFVDFDEMMASMAESYDVRRAAWEGDATATELATGRRNCPREVP